MNYKDKSKDELIEMLVESNREFDSLRTLYDREILKRTSIEISHAERLKELNCHNQISGIITRSTLSIDEVIDEIVQILPAAFQFPAMAAARIVVNAKVFTTSNYQNSKKCLRQEIRTGRNALDYIEVSYPEAQPSPESTAFLAEESDLLFTVAERLGNFIENKTYLKFIQTEEERYRKLLDNISEVIYEIDHTGVILYISPSIEKISGYIPEEVIGRSFADLVGENREFLARRLAELREKLKLETEYKLQTKTGESCWVRLSTHALFEDGIFSGGSGTLFNITEKKLVELELQKSEALYLSILNSSPDVITITDTVGRIKFTSPKASEMFGYPESEVLFNMSVFDFIIETERQKAADSVQHHFLGSVPGAEEYTAIRYDGSTFNVEINGRFIEGSDGKPDSLIFVTRDITSRKHTEEILRQSEAKYRNIFENMQDAYYEASTDGTILDISPSIEIITNGQFSRNELIGQSIIGFYSEPDARSAFFTELFKRGKVTDYELLFSNKDGSVIPVAISSVILFDVNGKPEKISGSIRDISERKKAEEALRTSEALYRTILNASPDIITITNLEGKILIASPNVLPMFGYDRIDQVLNQDFKAFIVSEEREKAEAEITSMFQGKLSGPGEYKAIRADESLFDIEVNSEFIRNDEGAPISIVFIVRDITGRKLAEHELIAANKKTEESEKKFRSIVQSQAEGIGLVNANEIFEFVNLAAYKIFETDKLIGVSLFDFLQPGEIELISHQTGNRRDGITNAYELQITTKKGNAKYINVSSSPKFDGNGEYTGAYGVFSDITERKRAEMALQESEEKYRKDLLLLTSILESPVNIIVFSIDSQYCYTAFTQFHKETIKKIWGVDIQVGMNLLDVISNPSQKETAKSNFDRALAGEYFVLTEEYGDEQNKDYTENYYSAIRNPEGEIVGVSVFVIDVSKRKQSELKLIKSEERFRQVVEQSQEVVWEVDANGLYTYVSPLAKSVYGYSPEQMIGKIHFYDLHPENIKDASKKAAFEVFSRKGDFYNLTGSMIRPDGVEVVILTNGIPMLAENGDLLGYRGIDTDITERKQDEEKIRQQNERLSAIVSAMPDIIFVIDNEGTYTEFYSPAPDLLFIPDDQIVGLNVRKVFDKELADLHMSKINECINEKKLITYDYRLKADSAESFYEARLAPFGDKKTLAFIRDITVSKLSEKEILDLNANLERKVEERTLQLTETNTNLWQEIEERKLAQEALQQSSQKWEAIISASPDGIGMVSLDGKLQLVSDKLPEMYGYSIEDKDMFIGRTIFDFLDPLEVPRMIDNFHKLLKGEKEYKISEYVAIKKDKSHLHVEVNSSLLLDSQGKPSSILFVERDVTERKRIEDDLEENREKYRGLSEASIEAIFLSEKGKCIEQNLAAEKMFGYTSEEALTRYGTEWIVPEDRDMVMNHMLTGYDKPYEATALRKDGTTFPCMLVGRMMYYKGKNVRVTSLNDITIRKQAERELNQIATRLSLAVQAGGVGVWDFDIDNNKLYWDDQMFALYGLSKHDFSGAYEAWQTGLHPEDRLRGDREIQMAISGDKEFDTEFRVVWPDGTIRVIRAMAVVERDFAGKPVNLVGTNWDITDQKQAEAAMRASELKHSSMIANISDVIGIMGTDGVMKYKSPNIEKYFGWKPEDLVGTDGWLTVHPDDIDRIQAEFVSLLETEYSAKTVEYNYKCKDGSYKPIELTATNLSNDSVINGILLNYHDITARREADNALRESETRFSLFMDNLPAVIFLKDHDGRTLFVNKYMDSAFGASAWVGKTMQEVFPNDLGEKLNAGDKSSMALGYQKIEEDMLHLDGKVHSYEIQKFIIPQLDKAPLLGGISLDITERKAAESAIMKAKNEADKANLAKSEFLSRMSHELRTPMNAILGFAQLMKMGALMPAHKKGVDHILNSGRHLLNLINEVLDISQIEAGHISLSMEPVQLSGIIGEMMDTVQPLASLRHLNMALNYSPVNQLFVKSDRKRLKQILLNLLNNAVKYNREGGSISVKTEAREANEAGMVYLRISVTDTGYGISAEDISKIFTPFERIGAEKTKTEGTGLGLAVVKRLIDAMEGEIGVESTPDLGTTFWIELPRTESQSESYHNSEKLTGIPDAQIRKNGTILYIEDNKSNIELIEQILATQRPGIQLISNYTGNETVQLATDYKPDLILLDLDLPDIHGSDVLKLLAGNEKTKSIPVVIISADAMPHQLQKLLNSGARKYLTKPLDLIEFLKVIDEWIRS